MDVGWVYCNEFNIGLKPHLCSITFLFKLFESVASQSTSTNISSWTWSTKWATERISSTAVHRHRLTETGSGASAIWAWWARTIATTKLWLSTLSWRLLTTSAGSASSLRLWLVESTTTFALGNDRMNLNRKKSSFSII